MNFIGKRAALFLGTLGITGMLVAGASFAMFSSTANSQTDTFAAGTVVLNGPEAPQNFNIGPIAPGDSVSNAEAYTVTYAGNLNAWIGLDVAESGAIFGGSHPLAVTIKDTANSQTFGVGTDQVVGNAPVADNWTDTFDVSYSMPLAADNTYQGATGTVTLTAHAVQSANNTNNSNTGPTSWM